jgi:hypothetical protein
LRLECFDPSILKPASRPVTSQRESQMLPCTSPNPPLRAQRAPAVAGSFFGTNPKCRRAPPTSGYRGRADALNPLQDPGPACPDVLWFEQWP